ncbi:PP2C family serine/threonine-protein phosphatase [Vreelandella populi]|uniref:PP2C family serine/threonine-protein phosphatase n=1 Tax=Vreelandella populi TaxID=2498858 RepID=UPI000F8D35F3|nr:hypothetical protein [Halomonas populi]RUR55187.1 hypothetical protein ELY40_06600 [Halomonas populi]
MKVRVTWYSRKGVDRLQNCDAGALIMNADRLVVVLVDASEKGPTGAELAKLWAHTVAGHSLMAASTEAIIKNMKEEHKNLRHVHLLDTAAYCVAILDRCSRELVILHCGDCMAGLGEAKNPDWLTEPHTLSRQPGITTKTPENATKQQHTLTRNLNAKRFVTPDITTSIITDSSELFLCSDGYWRYILNQAPTTPNISDDASVLTIAFKWNNNYEDDICCDSDVDNFLIKNLQ